MNKKVLLCLFLLAAQVPARADENAFLTPPYLKRAGNDFLELVTMPARWDKKDWLIAGGIFGASFAAFAVDDDIRTHYRKHRSGLLKSVSSVTTHFGDYKYELPVIAGTWAVGLATKNKTLGKIAADGAEASIFAAGMVTPLLTYATGRRLPRDNENAMKFKPFTPGRFGYPSGHTTEAFAMATVIDQNLRKSCGYWPTPFLYAIAVGTAHSRIYDGAHYLSDVVLGAGIGWAVGYWIANKPRNVETAVSVIPISGGAALSFRY